MPPESESIKGAVFLKGQTPPYPKATLKKRSGWTAGKKESWLVGGAACPAGMLQHKRFKYGGNLFLLAS